MKTSDVMNEHDKVVQQLQAYEYVVIDSLHSDLQK